MNADEAELRKFSDLAHRWWDATGEFRPLHAINPVRLEWIDAAVGLPGKRVIDVGCGGGILAESMAARGAAVTGIDLADKPLTVARMHSLESGVTVHYQTVSAEELAARMPGHFDVVTCMEMLEHVPDPGAVVQACAALAKPGGTVFFSTINRNARAYLSAIVAAEYVLNLLPKGTHDYAKLIKPSELAHYARSAGLVVGELRGLSYNPVTHAARLNQDTGVNYLMRCERPASEAGA